MDYSCIFKGVLEVCVKEGKLRPKRFSEKQYKKYTGIQKRAPFAEADAGVRLEFLSNADKITFSYNVLEKWDWWYNGNVPVFSVLENGLLRDNITICEEGKFEYIKKETGFSKICIYLPVICALELFEFNLGDFKVKEETESKLLVLGDSISQGLMNVTPYSSYSNILAKYFNLDLLNQSVGGNIYEPEIFDFGISFKPEVTVLALGINDVGMISNCGWDEEVTKDYTFEKAEENIRLCLEMVKENIKGKVIVITPMINFDRTAEYMENFRKIRRLIEKEALKRGFNVIDGLELIPADRRYFTDHCHPNDLGFHIMAENLISIIEKNSLI